MHWSSKICELSHAPLATEYVCFFRVLRHEDAALKCIVALCQFQNSDITLFHAKNQFTIENHSAILRSTHSEHVASSAINTSNTSKGASRVRSKLYKMTPFMVPHELDRTVQDHIRTPFIMEGKNDICKPKQIKYILS